MAVATSGSALILSLVAGGGIVSVSTVFVSTYMLTLYSMFCIAGRNLFLGGVVLWL